MDDRMRVRAVVSGTVQGVGFRYWAREEAQRLGLSGYVVNRADGSVETEAEGAAASVARYVEWLATGPEWADVASVQTTDVVPRGTDGFELRH